MLGCDGIFEKLDNVDVNDCVWNSTRNLFAPEYVKDARTIHEKLGSGVDEILKNSAYKKSFDNITSVLVAFDNYEIECAS